MRESKSQASHSETKTLGAERRAIAATEVQKLLEVGFIRECQYLERVSNIVLVKMPMGHGGCVLTSLI